MSEDINRCSWWLKLYVCYAVFLINYYLAIMIRNPTTSREWCDNPMDVIFNIDCHLINWDKAINTIIVDSFCRWILIQRFIRNKWLQSYDCTWHPDWPLCVFSMHGKNSIIYKDDVLFSAGINESIISYINVKIRVDMEARNKNIIVLINDILIGLVTHGNHILLACVKRCLANTLLITSKWDQRIQLYLEWRLIWWSWSFLLFSSIVVANNHCKWLSDEGALM